MEEAPLTVVVGLNVPQVEAGVQDQVTPPIALSLFTLATTGVWLLTGKLNPTELMSTVMGAGPLLVLLQPTKPAVVARAVAPRAIVLRVVPRATKMRVD
jgi:hypothetical protein